VPHRRKQTLRQAQLRDHLAKIARIAKADLPSVPELQPLRMPKGKPTVEKLAAAATGMADTAKPHADVFIAAGLPTDFIAQLVAATDAMTSAISERTSNRGRRSGATVGLKQKLSAGRNHRTMGAQRSYLTIGSPLASAKLATNGSSRPTNGRES
jgi:hypothetical protein